MPMSLPCARAYSAPRERAADAPAASVLSHARHDFSQVCVIALVLLGTAAPLAAAQFPPDSFTNLKVLPRDIPKNELVAMMAGFTRALGVRCTYCHVGEEAKPLETYDFTNDEKLAKRKARTMIAMLGRINDIELAGLEERGSPAVRVQCITCHRGASRPRMLQEVLQEAYAAAGIDSLLAAYTALRARNYGRFVYDFSEVPLSDLATQVNASGHGADARRIAELNVTMNPESQLAQTQFVRLALLSVFSDSSAASGRAEHARLTARFGGVPFPEPLLNDVGYTLLRRGRVPAAIEVFRLNAEEYPRSANVYDSLGEAYTAAGNIAEAIRNYERSLQLDPANRNASEKLLELRRRRGGS